MTKSPAPKAERRVVRGFGGWPGDIPFVVAHDFALLPYLSAIYALCALLPERVWERVSAGLAQLLARLGGRHLSAVANLPAGALDLETVRRHYQARILNQFYFLAHYVPWRSPPRVRLDGAQLIHDALAAGNGAVIWMQPTAFGDLGTKAAFHEAGFEVYHLSRFTHGVSYSALGAKFLNPLWTRVEERYLAKRLVMAPGGSMSALQALTRHLKRNRIVSIAAGGQSQVVRTLKFQDELLNLSAGPAVLAWKRKAALLTVSTIKEAGGDLVAHVHEMPHAGQFKNRDEFIDAVLGEYASQLESVAGRVPEQLKLDNLRLGGVVTN